MGPARQPASDVPTPEADVEKRVAPAAVAHERPDKPLVHEAAPRQEPVDGSELMVGTLEQRGIAVRAVHGLGQVTGAFGEG